MKYCTEKKIILSKISKIHVTYYLEKMYDLDKCKFNWELQF